MIKAIFLDFFGTIVHEDGHVGRHLTQEIMRTGQVDDLKTLRDFWGKTYRSILAGAHGENFVRQKILEERTLARVFERFACPLDPRPFNQMTIDHWHRPPIFEDARRFMESCPLPIYIVSNIDTDDIMPAIEYHNMTCAGVVTSEDARAYKPRPEMFHMALELAGLKPQEVVHVGDSLTNDVGGATPLGIKTVWINRESLEKPEVVQYMTADMMEILPMFGL